MKTKYERLLDNVYELEGLLHLAIVRESAPHRIEALIREKAKSLNEMIEAEIVAPAESEEEEFERIDENVYVVEDASETEPEEVVSEEEADFPSGEESEENIPFEEESGEDISFEEESEEEADLPSEEDEEEDEDDEEDEYLLDDEEYYEEEPDAFGVEWDEEESDRDVEPELDNEDEPDEEPETAEEEKPAETEPVETEPIAVKVTVARDIKPEVKRRKAPSFSINDRFLFVREIFKGDSARFRTEMESLDKFENYREAEEYFVEEYDLDPEEKTATSFLAVIYKYFD